MYLARFSYDISPADRQRALELIGAKSQPPATRNCRRAFSCR
jgi:hypothetical protein